MILVSQTVRRSRLRTPFVKHSGLVVEILICDFCINAFGLMKKILQYFMRHFVKCLRDLTFMSVFHCVINNDKKVPSDVDYVPS